MKFSDLKTTRAITLSKDKLKMLDFFFKGNKSNSNTISYKLIILESLLFLLPFLVLSYIFYQIHIGFSHLLLFSFILLLVLAGLVMLRQFFDRISNVAMFLKKAESGAIATMEIKKDVSELHDISISFNNLVTKLEQTSGELSQRALELLAIKELIDIARKSLDIDDLMNILLEKSMKVTGATIGSVFMVDPSCQRFRVVAAKGHKDELKKDSYIDISDSLAKSCLSEAKTVLIQDIESDPRTHKTNDPNYGPPSFISMPIPVENKLAAVVNLAHKENGKLFDNNDEQVLSIMLGEMGFALENAILHKKVKEQLEEIKNHTIKLEKEFTDRKETEKALFDSEKKYRLLVENSNDIIYTINIRGYFTYVNPVAERVTGFPESELVGKNYLSLVRPDFHDEIKAFYKKQFNENMPNTYFEFPVTIYDGTTKWIGQNVQCLFDNENIIGFQSVSRDITDRKLAEERMATLNKELEEVNKQLRLAYASMRDSHDELKENIFKEEMAFLINKEGLIVGATERALEYTGMSRTKLIDSNILNLLHVNYRDVFIDEFKQAWLGVTQEFTINIISNKKDSDGFSVKCTRINLDNQRLILATLR